MKSRKTPNVLRFAALLPLILSLTAVSCKKRLEDARVESATVASATGASGSPDRCVALRGNGTHMIAHFTALARMTLRWGEIQGFAGGSSGTMTPFLYESIIMNPAVRALGPDERPKAISLLLKSTFGYALATGDSPEWQALISAGTIASKVASSGVQSLASADYKKAAADLLKILSSPEIRGLINPEILGMLANTSEPRFKDYQTRVDEVKKAAKSLTDLDASDPDVFFRPGLLNFDHFIDLIGRVGDFYSGRGVPQDQMAEFLKSCSEGTDSQLWSDIAKKSIGAETCGTKFAKMVSAWRGTAPTGGSRLDDKPGKVLPVILMTSVVTNPAAVAKMKEFEVAYHKGTKRHLDVAFEDVKFGYWVSKSFGGDPVAKWNSKNPDGRSKKALNLGAPKTWREVLRKSPREPSLGKYTEFAASEKYPGALSLGGWSDLSPVPVLKAAGCDKVIYLTRSRPETVFIAQGQPFNGRKPSGLAEILGMGEDGYNDIYNLDTPASAFSKAIAAADGIWCTDWNQFAATQQEQIGAESFVSPLITKDPELSKWPEAQTDGPPIVGCRAAR
jgi:hypothetical protein